MGEEVKMSDYEMEIDGEENGDCNGGRGGNFGDGDGDDDERVHEWEEGLPSGDDLTPLSQLLIPPGLASAFSISPEPGRTFHEVNRASRQTLTSLRCGGGDGDGVASSHALNFKSFSENHDGVVEADDDNNINGTDRDGSEPQSRKLRKLVAECSGHGSGNGTEAADADSSAAGAADARTLKRPRLVWTPQLHKRFVDVVAHLGIKNAVPKTIMQLMNVEGLTRENVASHLQKYRLYLKRMQGGIGSDGGPSNSEQQLFESLNEGGGGGGGGVGGGGGGGGDGGGGGGGCGGGGNNNNNNNNGQMGLPAIPMPYQMVPMPVQMPVYAQHHHMAVPIGSHHQYHQYQHHAFDGNHPYSMMQQQQQEQQQQRDWSGNNCGSVVSYPRHVAPSDNN